VTPTQLAKLDRQLSSYIDYLTDGMGRPERRRALSWYMTGLLLDGESKSTVSMAGRLVDDEREIEAMRQRLQQCVAVSTWADAEIRRRLALRLEHEICPDAYVIDDTGFAKKGTHSVGVSRQYSGTLGRVDNCQVAPSLHVAADHGSGCIGMRLYLPEDWASDIQRRESAGVPEFVVFKRKWEIGLELLSEALSAGLPRHVVLADAGYGDSTEFRDGLAALGCNYLVGVSGIRLIWPPGSQPRAPTKHVGPGRPRTQFRDDTRKPVALTELAETLDYRKFSCPDGVGGKKSGYFAFLRVRSAERHTKGRPPSNELWLVAEWRPGNNERKFYFSDLPETTSRKELVRLVKLRWRIERDYQEMKGEVGLDHFEGRTWRGFHHHATLCAAAHGFLAIQRRLFPPAPISLDAPHGEAAHSSDLDRADRRLPAVPTGI